MTEQNISNKDWILFRNRIAGWQEAYMDKLNKEYIDLLCEDANPSDKFGRLEKRINSDKKKAGVRLEMSRSSLIRNIVSLINEGAISLDDLEEFSDELKQAVHPMIER